VAHVLLLTGFGLPSGISAADPGADDLTVSVIGGTVALARQENRPW
jgi:hypothetical protein